MATHKSLFRELHKFAVSLLCRSTKVGREAEKFRKSCDRNAQSATYRVKRHF